MAGDQAGADPDGNLQPGKGAGHRRSNGPRPRLITALGRAPPGSGHPFPGRPPFCRPRPSRCIAGPRDGDLPHDTASRNTGSPAVRKGPGKPSDWDLVEVEVPRAGRGQFHRRAQPISRSTRPCAVDERGRSYRPHRCNRPRSCSETALGRVIASANPQFDRRITCPGRVSASQSTPSLRRPVCKDPPPTGLARRLSWESSG